MLPCLEWLGSSVACPWCFVEIFFVVNARFFVFFLHRKGEEISESEESSTGLAPDSDKQTDGDPRLRVTRGMCEIGGHDDRKGATRIPNTHPFQIQTTCDFLHYYRCFSSGRKLLLRQ